MTEPVRMVKIEEAIRSAQYRAAKAFKVYMFWWPDQELAQRVLERRAELARLRALAASGISEVPEK